MPWACVLGCWLSKKNNSTKSPKELYSKERWSNCRWCRGGRGKSAVTPHTTPVPHPFLVRFLSHFDQLAVGVSIKVLETCFYWASLFLTVPLCRPNTCQPARRWARQLNHLGRCPGVDIAGGTALLTESIQVLYLSSFCQCHQKEDTVPVKSEKKKVSHQAMPE